MTSRSQNDQQIKSAARTFAILEAIKERNGAGVTELANHVGIAKSTMHNYLTTLQQDGYLVKRDDEYRLGLRFLSLGGHVRNANKEYRRLYTAGRQEITELAYEIGEKVHLAVEESGRGIILYQESGPGAIETDSHTGSEIYLHTSSFGKAILAHLPDERVKRIVDRHGLVTETSQTITEQEQLLKELERIQDRGYAFDNEERTKGIRCVGVPLINDTNDVLGAISISGPTRRISKERIEDELLDRLQESARLIILNAMYS